MLIVFCFRTDFAALLLVLFCSFVGVFGDCTLVLTFPSLGDVHQQKFDFCALYLALIF